VSLVPWLLLLAIELFQVVPELFVRICPAVIA